MTLRPQPFRLLVLALSLIFTGGIFAQVTTQTVRGTILDQDTHQPIPGAAVVVVGSDPLRAASTDTEGRFIIPKVATGRIDLVVKMMGFEEQKRSNLLLTSGRELVVNVHLLSAVVIGKEVTIHADRKRNDLRNDMVPVSGRRISVEETSRIAGGINDPARMVSTFPGVAGDPSGDNTIVARGNSPTGVLWRLEGVEIPNPNHFSNEGSTGGPINVLNSDMLDDSEFYTGAFAPEYGNALSAVFDMRLRDGNDTEREYTLKAGVLGTDLTAEGPMPGVHGGSYLANFRYSTLSLLDQAGIVDYQGVPEYTDAAFKLKLPAGDVGTFSLYGLGGRSSIHQEQRSEQGDSLLSENTFGSRMGVIGLSYLRTLGENSYLQSTLSMSGNGSGFDYHETDAPEETPLVLRASSDLAKWTIRSSTILNNRLNTKHKLRSGIILSVDRFKMRADDWDRSTARMERQLDARGEATTLQAFTSWRWRWNEQWTMTSGVHVLHFALTNATSVEPRAGIRYQMKPGRAFTAGAGLHAKTETAMTYLAQVTDQQGHTSRPNRMLGLSKAAHVVVGYEHMITEDIQVKAEAYYQYHFNVPVENDPTSAFTLSNSSDWFTNKPLVNKGKGRNYGIELAVEKYFTRGYHFMVTASLSDARDKALDGVWRNSRFNMGAVANALAGKEWQMGRNGKDRVLTTGFRYSIIGGQYSTPIDLEASRLAGTQVDGGTPWSRKGAPVQKLDVVVAYRAVRPKVSHEIKADVQNVLNSSTAVYHYYDNRTKAIGTVPQLALLPVLQYTLRF